jgi:asparagine synthase (glutamine-hydrolysing)
MCGIAGFVGRYGAETARAMARLIAHRGPDDEGFFFDAACGVALAHRRLAIIDLSPTGHQPMSDRSGRFTICYNGEIYNSPELRRELEQRGVQFRGSSDTEVLIELFAREGASSLGRLNGIFALAIWDKQERELHLARDGMGVKPLYIAETRSGLAFASEMKAFLALPDLDREIDTAALGAYLTYLWSPAERTMFRNVRKLEPGTWMTVSSAGRRGGGHFYVLPDPVPREAGDDELIGGTRERLRVAVERQMLADVEVGAFLSGGLDSSSIVAFARRTSGGSKLRCFTIDYRARADEAGEMVADLPYARQAASHLGVELHEVTADASMATDLERMVYHLDEPQADPAALNSLYIAELARRQGIKVLLSGTGGDDLLTGYRRHQAARLERYWEWVPRPVRQLAATAGTLLPTKFTSARRFRKLVTPLAQALDKRLGAYFEWLPAEEAAQLIAGQRAAVQDIREPLDRVLHETRGWPAVERVLRLDQRFFLVDHNLNYTDKTGMASGVEIRVPFLDPDLVAWAAALPPGAKMRGGETKWVLRKAMEPMLPKDIIYRPKTGFGVPLRAWLRSELRPMAEELLATHVVATRGFFDAAAARQLKDDTFAGRRDGSYTLLAMMSVELWARHFIDRPREAVAA